MTSTLEAPEPRRQRARRWKQEARALYLAVGHPRVPWYAKAWLMLEHHAEPGPTGSGRLPAVRGTGRRTRLGSAPPRQT